MILKPKIVNNNIPTTQQNFFFKSCKIWNALAKDIFVKNKINSSLGYIIPGEETNSDLSTSTAFIKERLSQVLMTKQSAGLDQFWDKSQFEI